MHVDSGIIILEIDVSSLEGSSDIAVDPEIRQTILCSMNSLRYYNKSMKLPCNLQQDHLYFYDIERNR